MKFIAGWQNWQKLRFRQSVSGKANPVSIGVLGTARGIGTTHFTVMLANCLANGMGYRTAAVEYNGHKDFMRICGKAVPEAEDMRHFSYHGIDFHTCANGREVADISASGYEMVVFDMDASDSVCLEEFIRCQARVAICSVQMWRISTTRNFLAQFSDLQFAAAMFAADPKEEKNLSSAHGREFWDIPVEGNPFCMSAGSLAWLKEFAGAEGIGKAL